MSHSLLLYSANLRFVLLFSLPPLPRLVYKTIPVSLVLEGLISWITSRNSMQGATLECLYTTSTCSVTAFKVFYKSHCEIIIVQNTLSRIRKLLVHLVHEIKSWGVQSPAFFFVRFAVRFSNDGILLSPAAITRIPGRCQNALIQACPPTLITVAGI